MKYKKEISISVYESNANQLPLAQLLTSGLRGLVEWPAIQV